MPTLLHLVAAALLGVDQPRFIDMTDAVGLGADVIPGTIARLCFVDLDGDDWPDVVIDRHRVFLNRPDATSPIGRRFVEVPPERTGLREPGRSSITVFADLDNDGARDAIVTEYVDAKNPSWTDHRRRTSWQRGHGDGTFDPPVAIAAAHPATTSAIAVGDVDRDGRLDLWLGQWYVHYGESLAAYRNELLLQVPPEETGGRTAWKAVVLPPEPGDAATAPVPGDADPADPAAGEPDPEKDDRGRPTYGAMIADLDGRGGPELLELNYGRRWNRCWVLGVATAAAPLGADPADARAWHDIAPTIGFDADDHRDGRYPQWLKDRAKTDPRFEREDEAPYRTGGNTFDASVGDVDDDGDFDLLITEITHGWAGDSSDRTRLLLNRLAESGELGFEPDPVRSLDRPRADPRKWNQGDLFGAWADLDEDGRLDLVLSSGDYRDDQRLRAFIQQPDGTLRDETATLGLDHDGSQQISLADVDGDGDLDLLAGQTFFRYTAEQRAGRSPHPRLFINETTEGRRSITLRLRGDGVKVSCDALGAIVRAKREDGTVLSRQLIGIGGHAGKQTDFLIHLGLGSANRVESLSIEWPDRKRTLQELGPIEAGAYVIPFGGKPEKLTSGELE